MNVVGDHIANPDAGQLPLARLRSKDTQRLTVWKVNLVPRLRTVERACAAKLKEWATEDQNDRFVELDARDKIK